MSSTASLGERRAQLTYSHRISLSSRTPRDLFVHPSRPLAVVVAAAADVYASCHKSKLERCRARESRCKMKNVEGGHHGPRERVATATSLGPPDMRSFSTRYAAFCRPQQFCARCEDENRGAKARKGMTRDRARSKRMRVDSGDVFARFERAAQAHSDAQRSQLRGQLSKALRPLDL